MTERIRQSLFDYKNYPFSHLEDSLLKAEQIKKVLSGDFRASSLVDIGSNIGVITREVGMQVRAKRVVGIDLADKAMEAAVKNLSIFETSEVLQCNFFEYAPPDNFDLAMFIDVLEHFEDPSAALKRASQMASFCVVRSPLEDSLVNRFNRRFLDRDFYQIMEDRYGHTQHFTRDGFRDIISGSGFSVLTEETFRIPQNAQILETASHRYAERLAWNLARPQYPDLWGGFYIALCKSRMVSTLDQETYTAIRAMIMEELGEDNVAGIVLFGSAASDNARLYSDYDFAIVAKELSGDVYEREAASPRIKRRLRELGVSNLGAFNLYTQTEYESADRRRTWLIEAMKARYRVLHDTDGFLERSLACKKVGVETIDEYSWKNIDVESVERFIEVANRHLECAQILDSVDPQIAAYHRREGQRGLLIAELYKYGEYNTKGSRLQLAKRLVYGFGVELDLSQIQKDEYEYETEQKKAVFDYESVKRNLTAAKLLEEKGYPLEALFHTYSALRNLYLKALHSNDIYTFDGEISQLFLREFGDKLNPELVNLIYSNAFQSEQILGRSGYNSFDIDSEGKPLYEEGNVSNPKYVELMTKLQTIITSLKASLPTVLVEMDGTEPKISIVIATYNRQQHLLNCLKSLNNLIIPRDKVEVIIVDDGSWVQYDQEELQRNSEFEVRYVRKEHSGICATKNKGIDESKGEYVAFLDDDMVVSPFWLVNLMSGFTDERIAGVGSTNLTYPDDNYFTQYSDYRELIRAPFRDETGSILNLITASAVLRRSVLQEVEGFNNKQTEMGVSFGGDDVDLTWKIRNLGYKLSHIKDAICFHNHRSSYLALVKQHIGYGEGTMFHCIDKSRNPAELGIPKPTYKDVIYDLSSYFITELPKRVLECYSSRLGWKKAIEYPLLDFSRRFFYDIGILKARKYLP